MSDDKILIQARESYDRFTAWWSDNHEEAKDDLRFARLGEQWPDGIKKKRELEGRPCETFNKQPSFIRQVVNDARQNKPSIKVHPQDSGADPQVAEILNGLIRNIEATSDADVAYDTAIEDAVSTGFGYWRINTAYSCDDAFDQDIVIERVANQFTVLGDIRSQAADSSDWNEAFIVTSMTKAEFEREYPNADKVDWDTDFADCPNWLDGDDVTVAEYWVRKKVRSEIVLLSDGTVVKADDLAAAPEKYAGLEVVGEPREVESYKVTQHIMSGAEVLKTVAWPGKYIPIIPVYGDEVVDEDGKRHFRSLIRDAKGAQRMYNYMRNTGIELIGLAPKVPFIGRKGAFESDPNWQNVNDQSIPYLEFDGAEAPQRQSGPTVPQGVLQEALNANDDMKAIIGIYDASLGARSNETSGRAIMARQREGDVSTFHFIDNLSRSIRHGGRVVLDLIPSVFPKERIIRTLGEDLTPANVKIAPTGQAVTHEIGEDGVPQAIYDITAGKYDMTVSAGPSFTTRREEAAMQMEAFIEKVPEAAVLIGDLYAKSLDWPMADDIAERLKRLVPPEALGEAQGPQIPPEVEQQMQEGMALIQQLQQELAQAQAKAADKAQENALKQADLRLKEQQTSIDFYRAETERMQAQKPVMAPRAA